MRILEEALTFDDVLLVPAYSEVLPREVDLSTQLTRKIRLNLPIVSAAMDTVTEARLAIAIAQEGGIGIIHKSMTIEAQALEVARVKKFESGVVVDPITVTPETTIREGLDITRSKGISGMPVVRGKQVVGIVTSRDLRFETHLDAPVSSVMTPQDRLVTVRENAPREDVLQLFHKHRIEKVLVVGDHHELRGLITVKDIQKATERPRACKDESGRLRVGAAVGTSPDTLDRVAALREAGVDAVVVDTSHGHSRGVIQMVEKVQSRWGDLQVIAGNIVTVDAAKALVAAGADGVKVGIGPGSICTTRNVAGVGVQPQGSLSAVSSASFGTVNVGNSATRQFTFANTGTAPATGVYASLVAATGLSLSANSCGTLAAPVMVGAGQSCSMTVSWAPTSAGSLASTLSVTSSAPGSPHALALSGTAASLDPAGASVSLLLNADASPLADTSGKAIALTAYGNAAVTTTRSRFGTGSLALDGTGDYVVAAANTGFGFGTGDFTIEAWVYPSGTQKGSSTVMDFRSSGAGSTQSRSLIQLYGNGILRYYVAGFQPTGMSTTVALNAWHHVAYSRAAGVGRFFVNGVQVGSNFADSYSYGANPDLVLGQVGDNRSFADGFFTGFIDEVRITKGVGRYTANFTLPSSAFPTP